MNVHVFALHGFLGNTTDWDEVFFFIKKEKPDWKLHAVDLFSIAEPHLGFEMWANKFNEWVEVKTKSSAKQSALNIVVGYSMGGRLALHAVDAKPELWSGAVFLSTNPGLSSAQEKKQRLQTDSEWATRFANEDFQKVWQDWNKQDLFKNSVEPDRKIQNNFDKKNSIACLQSWSLAKQKDFRSIVDLWNVRQIWAAGEEDKKFCELLKSLPQSNEIQKWEVEHVSHRLIFDASLEVAHFVVRIGSPIVVE